ncbi:MAG: sortase [Ruminococcus sp.]|nr:sortase [Ruminococcus sp.]
MKHFIKKISIGFLSLLLMLMIVPFTAYAAGPGIISIMLSQCQIPISDLNTEISIYQVASRSDVGAFYLTDAFKDSGVTIEALESAGASEMNAIARTLKEYTGKKSIAYDSYVTALSQDCKVSGLEEGAYLVLIQDVRDSRYTCTFSPMVFLIPSVNAEGDNCWEIEAVPKFSLDRVTMTETATRETTATSATVVLGSTTPPSSQTETTPTTTPPSTAPQTETTTTGTTTVTTVSTVTTTVRTTVTTQKTEYLPQTGVLVWVVYLLAGLGIICLITVWGFSRKKSAGKTMKLLTLFIGCGCLAGAGAMYAEPYFVERASVPVMSMAVREIRKQQAMSVSEPEETEQTEFENEEGIFAEYTEVSSTEDAPGEETELPIAEAVPLTYTVDGSSYIGILEIPSIYLELPIASDCSMATLRNSPGCYAGTPAASDLVIGAHNYASHFGNLYLLSAGAEVYFTDVSGTLYTYHVADVTEVTPDQGEAVRNSEHDLALFTCNYSGARRVVVYCDLVE